MTKLMTPYLIAPIVAWAVSVLTLNARHADILLSVLLAALAILAILGVRRAMALGLVYRATNALLWAMILLAAGRVWHTVFIGSSRLVLGEYGFGILAYTILALVLHKSERIKTP